MVDPVEVAALAMATVIAQRHGHDPEDWLNDERRDEARAALASLPWGSADKDNMEYAAKVSCWQMDLIRK